MAEQHRKQYRGKPPISRHPLFPAIVALWFGALFGLGSFAIRPGLIESVILAGHIDSLIPAAAPPLGATARLLLALTMTGIGGTLGALFGRRIARPKPVVRERRRGAAPGSAPVRQRAQAVRGNRAEPAEAQASTQDAPTNRRRGLTAKEDSRPEFQDIAPLPGSAPQILNVADCAVEGLNELEERPLAAAPWTRVEPQAASLDLTPYADYVPAAPAAPAEFARQFEPAPPLPEPYAPPPTMQPPAPFAAPQSAPAAFATPPSIFSQPVLETAPRPIFSLPAGPAAQRIASAELGALSSVELLERMAMILQQRAAATAPAPEPFATVAEVPPVPQPYDFTAPSPAEPEPLPPAPLAIPAALRPLNLDDHDEDDPVPGFVPPRQISMPSAPETPQLSPVQQPTSEDTSAIAETLRAAAAGHFDQDLEADDTTLDSADDDPVLANGYSSLLELTRPAAPRQEFVRVEEPDYDRGEIEPAVVFPGHWAGHDAPFAPPTGGPFAAPPPVAPVEEVAPVVYPLGMRPFDSPSADQAPASAANAPAAPFHSPEETEIALRGALASLQRMSGAA